MGPKSWSLSTKLSSIGLYFVGSGRYSSSLSIAATGSKQTFTNINLAGAWNFKTEKLQTTHRGTEIFWNPGQQPTLEIITSQICLRSPRSPWTTRQICFLPAMKKKYPHFQCLFYLWVPFSIIIMFDNILRN